MVTEAVPEFGTDAWQDWVDRLLTERNELRRRVRDMEADQAAKSIETEAELTDLKRASHDLCAVLRNIINNPLLTRTGVQSKLTLAMQRFEREMGEDF